MIEAEKPINIQRCARRNLVWFQDVFSIVNIILRKNLFENGIVNVASPSTVSIDELVKIMEKIRKRSITACLT